MSNADRIAGIVNEWFQGLPTPTEQQRDRSALIGDLAYEVSRIRAAVAEEIAADIETRIRTWEGMSDQAQAGNENLRQAARIAREHGNH